MKVNINVTELSHDELVGILADALYECTWATVTYDKNTWESIPNKSEGKCLEDKLVDCLLAGYPIYVTDTEADKEGFGCVCAFTISEEGTTYQVTLKRILEVASTEEGFQLMKDTITGYGDYYTANNFLQRVMFGEEVYG